MVLASNLLMKYGVEGEKPVEHSGLQPIEMKKCIRLNLARLSQLEGFAAGECPCLQGLGSKVFTTPAISFEIREFAPK